MNNQIAETLNYINAKREIGIPLTRREVAIWELCNEQHEAIKAETAKKDEAAGYRDRKAGYYDKWYRYNRADNGAAYDKGCVRAVNEGKCADDFVLIECAEAAV